MTPFLAAVSIRTFATAKPGFIGIEVTADNASFDLVRQRYKAIQLIISPQRVMVVDGWHFGFGNNIEPEQRLFSMFFSESVAERCCLQHERSEVSLHAVQATRPKNPPGASATVCVKNKKTASKFTCKSLNPAGFDTSEAK